MFSNKGAIYIYLVVSILIHLVFIGIPIRPASDLTQAKAGLKITPLSKEEIEYLRTVGIKNGQKQFQDQLKPGKSGGQAELDRPKSIATPNATLEKTSDAKIQNEKNIAEQKDSSSNNKDSITNDKFTYDTNGKLVVTTSSDSQKQAIKHYLQDQKNVNNQLLAQISKTNNDETLLGKGFNMQFTPPEGVNENELNSAEKMFYAFQKRTFETYVSSFLRTHQKLLVEKPELKKYLDQDSFLLTGRISIDKEGNILSIKAIQWADNDLVQQLFEETLQSINKLPNPPKNLFKSNTDLPIYFQLKIN